MLIFTVQTFGWEQEHLYYFLILHWYTEDTKTNCFSNLYQYVLWIHQCNWQNRKQCANTIYRWCHHLPILTAAWILMQLQFTASVKCDSHIATTVKCSIILLTVVIFPVFHHCYNVYTIYFLTLKSPTLEVTHIAVLQTQMRYLTKAAWHQVWMRYARYFLNYGANSKMASI